MERYAIGIDVHKRFDNAHMVFGEYRDTDRGIDDFIDSFNREFRKFPSCADEFVRMARQLDGRDCHILIENSTNSHEVYHILVNLGMKVTVAHATDLRQITSSVKKNDVLDAERLAQYMRRRLNGELEFAESFIPGLQWMGRKELCRYIADDRLSVTNTKKQIRAHLAIVGNRDYDGHPDILARKVREELKTSGDPCLTNLIGKAESAMRRIYSDTGRIWEDMREIPMVRSLYSLPGAGRLTACYLTSLIIDIGRFPSSKRFVASFGLVPKLRESGDSSPECGITRRGDPVARRLIYQMTFVHIRHEGDGRIAAKYERMRKAGKSHNETIVACSNSLLRMLYVMLTEGREYVSDPKALEESRAEAETISDSEEVLQ